MNDPALFQSQFSAPALGDRRIIHRFMKVWAQCARGGFPSWSDLRAHDLGQDWNWLFVVDLAKSGTFPHFDYLGADLAKLADVHLAGGGDWAISILDRAAEDINAAVADQGPHLAEDTLMLDDGRAVLFRCMTAPLSEKDQVITHVVGVISGRLAEPGSFSYEASNDV